MKMAMKMAMKLVTKLYIENVYFAMSYIIKYERYKRSMQQMGGALILM